jgi:hypothetical protein
LYHDHYLQVLAWSLVAMPTVLKHFLCFMFLILVVKGY